MNVLVTGAYGQLGRCIRDQVDCVVSKNNGTDNVYFYTDIIESESDGIVKLDITNEDEVKQFIKDNYINVIVNCAAYTNVDKAETDKEGAYRLNALAPKYLAEAALAVGAKLIQISTDYVFAGTSFMPYIEERMCMPYTEYGATKYLGEKNIIETGCKYLIFRTAWLYSEYGNNFVKTMLKLFETKDELNVINDQIGTPTYAGNLANLIVSIIEAREPIEGKETLPLLENGIYHFTDEGVASWYDFARYIYECFCGRECKYVRINGITTKEYGSKTRRPYYSVLEKTKYRTDFKGLYNPQHWHDGVKKIVCKLLISDNQGSE